MQETKISDFEIQGQGQFSFTCISVESIEAVEFIRDSRGQTVFSFMYDSRQSEGISFVEL